MAEKGCSIKRAEAAVVGAPDAVYGEAVVAYVVPRAGDVLDAPALIDHCRTAIAGYKKPKHVRIVDTLPRNSLGRS
jgi:long-chain acyl-CoA synthetase